MRLRWKRLGWGLALVFSGWILLRPHTAVGPAQPPADGRASPQIPALLSDAPIPLHQRAKHSDDALQGLPTASPAPTSAHAELVPAAEFAKRGVVAAWKPHRPPIALDLELSEDITSHASLRNNNAMRTAYGFNLNKSNHIPLDHDWPDYRNDACKARKWPDPATLPKASVIIIFYNEPLSTLLRNVIAVLNRSPPELLGEIVLVDDHSQMEEHKLLPMHLKRLSSKLPQGKIRFERRNVHDGIVGARILGAERSSFPIIVFLDSHVEVCVGWLEPLASRIAEDRTRVVIPNVRGINVDTLELIKGGTWPPSRGSFNWKLAYTILLGDAELDVLEPNVNPHTSATKTAVMPGGLFAMDRRYFFELGAYDPEIKYYGGEHVEISFRVWMCGGSMEIVPCSNVGHIFREFNRFGQDKQLAGVNIGKILNRNDARVAEVWLDEYKEIFFRSRSLQNIDLGDLAPRKRLREQLKCKSFRWYLENVCRNHYVPDFGNTVTAHLSDPDGQFCVDSEGRHQGSAELVPCEKRSLSQSLVFTKQGYLQFIAHYNHKLICLRADVVSQMPCADAGTWKVASHGGPIESTDKQGHCLERGVYSGDVPKLRPCNTSRHQQSWFYELGKDGAGTLTGRYAETCLDNMQRHNGPPGLYACHGYGTQRWRVLEDGHIQSKGSETCLGLRASPSLFPCLSNDRDYVWVREGHLLRSLAEPTVCLSRQTSGGIALTSCDATNFNQHWNLK